MDYLSSSRPTRPSSQAPGNIESPAPRYGCKRHTEAPYVQLPTTAHPQAGTDGRGLPGWGPSTDNVLVTQHWRWNFGHANKLWGKGFPTGSTARLKASAQSGAPTPASTSTISQPSGSPSAVQQPQASGSQPVYQHAAHPCSGATQEATAVQGTPTVHGPSAAHIDGTQGARDSARIAEGASSSTAPIAPDVLRRTGANGDASVDANEASGTPHPPDRGQVLPSMHGMHGRYERYAEPNPAYRPPGSPSTSTCSTSSDSSSAVAVEGGGTRWQPDRPPTINSLRIIAEDGTSYIVMPAETDGERMRDYYQRKPHVARPHHRTAQPLRSAMRGAARNENRDEGAPWSGRIRAPGVYKHDNEEEFVPPLPSPPLRQQPTPPYEDDEDSDDDGDDDEVEVEVEPARGWRRPASPESQNITPRSGAWRREQTPARPRARPLPTPPTEAGVSTNDVRSGYYGGPEQGYLPPPLFGPPQFGWAYCQVCRHPASHHVTCPVFAQGAQPAQAPFPQQQQARDSVGSRSASRTTQRSEGRERHDRSPEDYRRSHHRRRQQTEERSHADADANAMPAAPTPQAPRPQTANTAGQIGNYIEGSPVRMSYWAAPPIARAQSTPAPDDSPAPVIPSPPQQRRRRELVRERPVIPQTITQEPTPPTAFVAPPRREQVVRPEPEPRRHHRRHRQRDIVTDVPVIPNLIPNDSSSHDADRSSRCTTVNTQLDTPPPSREPSPNTPTTGPNGGLPLPPQPVPPVWAQPTIPAGFPFPAVFPAIAWVPHPQPHPTIPAASFWQLPQGFPRVPTPAVAGMTGGWPLPGTAAGTWQTPAWPLAPTPASTASALTPAAGHTPLLAPDPTHAPQPVICPYLIPNPGNLGVPCLDWDVRMPPSMAKRYTARATVMPSITDKLGEVATHPPVPRLQITYHAAVPALLNYWGPIAVDKSGGGGGGEGGGAAVTVGDVLDAIHDFLQTPLTHVEAAELKRSHPAEWRKMNAAFTRRCREYPALSDVTWRQGMRRVDALADRYKWWGVWVHWNPDGSWYLNLGLVSKHSPK